MSKDQFNECDVVQDLLPLYYDNACSPASKKMVEQHLMTCEKCKKTYEALKNTTIDTVMKNESEGILERHAKKERNMAYKAGIVIALLLMVPVVITFIVSMSSGGGLGVFAVLTASMLLVASLSVVPHLGECNSITSYLLFCRPDEWRRRVYFMDDTNNFWIVCCIFSVGNQEYNIAPDFV